LSGENSETIGAWLLLLSAFVFGLPHGAYDFWLLTDTAIRQKKSRFHLVKLLLSYLFIALLTVALWVFLPSFAIVGFLFLTVWHFGSGDAVWEAVNKIDLIINSLGRGFILVFAPLTFFPTQSGTVLANLLPSQNAEIVDSLLNFAPFICVFGILLIFINCLFINQNSLFILLETSILIVFFWLTTPLLAVTIYLLGVHSWRHLLRLNVYENGYKSSENNNLWFMLSRFHRRALPVTLFSLLGIGLIIWLWQFQISDLANYTSAYLVLLSALTVPHAILITWTELNHRSPVLFQRI
jgi:beta-carotene 15,15'-dioxygenase